MQTLNISILPVHVNMEDFKPNEQQQQLHWKYSKLVSEISERNLVQKNISGPVLERLHLYSEISLKMLYIGKNSFHVKKTDQGTSDISNKDASKCSQNIWKVKSFSDIYVMSLVRTE